MHVHTPPPPDSSPLVSVIVPSYNHAKFIAKTIKSILAQEYNPIEIIVIDDCSTDDSRNILTSLAKAHKFKLILSEKNSGLIKTLNFGLAQASGKYFAPCASDDYWHCEKISAQVERMEAEPDLKILFTEGTEVDAADGRIGPVRYSSTSREKWYFEDVIFRADLPPASFMARRDEMFSVGGYSESFRIEDLPMWLSLLSIRGSYAGVIKRELAFYRSHDSNMHNVHSSMVIDEHYKIVDHFSLNNPRRKDILAEWNLRNGNFLAGIDKKRSLKYLGRAKFKFLDYRLYAGLYKNIFR